MYVYVCGWEISLLSLASMSYDYACFSLSLWLWGFRLDGFKQDLISNSASGRATPGGIDSLAWTRNRY